MCNLRFYIEPLQKSTKTSVPRQSSPAKYVEKQLSSLFFAICFTLRIKATASCPHFSHQTYCFTQEISAVFGEMFMIKYVNKLNLVFSVFLESFFERFLYLFKNLVICNRLYFILFFPVCQVVFWYFYAILPVKKREMCIFREISLQNPAKML